MYDVITGTASGGITATKRVRRGVSNVVAGAAQLFAGRDLPFLKGTTANEHLHWFLNRRTKFVTVIRPDLLESLMCWLLLCYNSSMRVGAQARLRAAGVDEATVGVLDSMFLLSHTISLYSSSCGTAPYIMLAHSGPRHMSMSQQGVPPAKSVTRDVTDEDRQALARAMDDICLGPLMLTIREQQRLCRTLQRMFFPDLTMQQVSGMILNIRKTPAEEMHTATMLDTFDSDSD